MLSKPTWLLGTTGFACVDITFADDIFAMLSLSYGRSSRIFDGISQCVIRTQEGLNEWQNGFCFGRTSPRRSSRSKSFGERGSRREV